MLMNADPHGAAQSRRGAWLGADGRQSLTAAALLQGLVDDGLATLPAPGGGHTLARWQALCDVASHDLSLAKLFEGHTDALAIMAELGAVPPPAGSTWGTWAAEAPQARVVMDIVEGGQVRLNGRKAWCSGAQSVSHGLMTVWSADGRGPWLVALAMAQPGVHVATGNWQSVGMAGSAALDVNLENAVGVCVGGAGDYLARPGFWQGGAGIAACWYGGCLTLAEALHAAVAPARPAESAKHAFRAAALGQVDLALRRTAALLREAAVWVDAHPAQDASAVAWRVRLAAEDCARVVLDETGRALGAAPFCMDARFARMAADLPVFVRQSHAQHDLAALGARVAQEASPWPL